MIKYVIPLEEKNKIYIPYSMEKIEHQKEYTTLPELKIWKYRSRLPIIQWWMGIWISMSELAGAVAYNGWIGTLSAAAIHMIPEYRKYRSNKIKEAKKIAGGELSEEENRNVFKEANTYWIKKEVKKAREIAQGNGLIFINIMVASKDYDDCVIAACKAWVDGIVSGAWLPQHLPELAKGHPDIALIPIVSDVRWTKILLSRYWEKQWKMPDAIVVEAPSKAWGHLWAKNIEEVYREDAKLENSIPAIREYLDSLWLQHVPVIAAWWIDNREDIDKVLRLWASWVQLWTRFLASTESNANEVFKDTVITAVQDDLIIILSSAWLPFRALKQSGTLTRLWGPKDREAKEHRCPKKCLHHCWYTIWDPNCIRMCILNELIRSTKWWNGDWLMSTGDYFDENWNSKITSILPVKEIMELLQKKAE